MKLIKFYNNLDKRLDGRMSGWLVFFIIPMLSAIYFVITTDFHVINKDGTEVGLWLDLPVLFMLAIVGEGAIVFVSLIIWFTYHKISSIIINHTSIIRNASGKWNSFVSSVKGAAQDELTESKVKFD